MSALSRAKVLEAGSDEFGVASHAGQLTLERHQFQTELFQVQLDQLDVAGARQYATTTTAAAAAAAEGCGDEEADDAEYDDQQLMTHRYGSWLYSLTQ